MARLPDPDLLRDALLLTGDTPFRIDLDGADALLVAVVSKFRYAKKKG